MYPILFMLLLPLLVMPAALAQEVAPDQLLKAVTQEVLTVLRGDQRLQAGQSARLAELVEKSVLPHFDFGHMARIAVARNWRLATPAQQAELAAEFKTLLVRTYVAALSGYRDQSIEFRRLWTAPGDTDVTVKTVIRQPGTVGLAMDYDMEKTATGWKVYDIKIEGISLITTYRDSFAGIVREGGVAGLIRSLSDKNRQGEAAPRPHPAESPAFPIIVRSVLQVGR